MVASLQDGPPESLPPGAHVLAKSPPKCIKVGLCDSQNAAAMLLCGFQSWHKRTKPLQLCSLVSLKILFIFRERGREGEKHHWVVASCAPPTGNLAHNPAMCPDWESNRQPFGLQADTQSTQSHQPGQLHSLLDPMLGGEPATVLRTLQQLYREASPGKEPRPPAKSPPHPAGQLRKPFWKQSL